MNCILQRYTVRAAVWDLTGPPKLVWWCAGKQGRWPMANSRGIDFGRNNRMGNVNISGDVAGRDLTKTTTSVEAVSNIRTKEQLLELLAQLHTDVGQLSEATDGQREDAQDELRKASSAAERGDRDRLVEKLEGAQRIFETIGSAAPAAVNLAQTV